MSAMSRVRDVPVLSRLRDRQFIVDTAVLAFMVLVLVLILTGGDEPGDATARPFDAGAAGLLAISAVMLFWGLRAPIVVLVLVFAISSSHTRPGWPVEPRPCSLPLPEYGPDSTGRTTATSPLSYDRSHGARTRT